MGLLALKIKQTGVVTKRLWAKAVKQALRDMGMVWHEEMLPKHFTESGARSYRYDRRTRKYRDRKQRLFGHRNPLVYSGASRTLARVSDIRSTSSRTRVVITAPNLRRDPRGKRTPMSVEVTRITRNETQRLVRVADQSLQRSLDAIARTAR